MALFTSILSPVSVSVPIRRRLIHSSRRPSRPFASLSSSESSSSTPAITSSNNESAVSSKTPPSKPLVKSSPQHDASFKYGQANPTGGSVVGFFRSTESNIERLIFDFRFLALLAVGGSLAGSLLCFLNGCIYIVDAYKVYWTSCVKGIHTGQMVLRLVEAIDVYLAGTVMLIFGMGLYGLFISNVPPDVSPNVDRALKGSSLFGMFSLKVVNHLFGRQSHASGQTVYSSDTNHYFLVAPLAFLKLNGSYWFTGKTKMDENQLT